MSERWQIGGWLRGPNHKSLDLRLDKLHDFLDY